MRVCKKCGEKLIQYGHKKQGYGVVNRYYKCRSCGRKYLICTESKDIYMKEV